MPYRFNFSVGRNRFPAVYPSYTYEGLQRVYKSLPRYNYIAGRHAVNPKSTRLPKRLGRVLFGGRKQPGFITRGLFRLGGSGNVRKKFLAPRKLSAPSSRHLASRLARVPGASFSSFRYPVAMPVNSPAQVAALTAVGQGVPPEQAAQIGDAVQAAADVQVQLNPNVRWPTLAEAEAWKRNVADDMRQRFLDQERASKAVKRQNEATVRRLEEIADADRRAIIARDPYASYNRYESDGRIVTRVPALIGPAKRRA